MTKSIGEVAFNEYSTFPNAEYSIDSFIERDVFQLALGLIDIVVD